jgi:Flp pilus assembly protein TadD
MSPSNAYYQNNRGRILATLARKDLVRLPAAEASFREAVRLAPQSPLFNLNWGVALSEMGRGKEAREAVRTAARLDAGFTAQVLAQMVDLEGLSGNRERAVRLEGLLEAVKE